jgi:hypothetical protein
LKESFFRDKTNPSSLAFISAKLVAQNVLLETSGTVWEGISVAGVYQTRVATMEYVPGS